MKLRYYGYPPEPGKISVLQEIKDLMNGDNESLAAAMDFWNALIAMKKSKQLLARPMKLATFQDHFQRDESLWSRTYKGYSFYLSRKAMASILEEQVEIRALLACNGIDPEPARVFTAAHRHKQM